MATAGRDPLSSLRQTATYLCHCAHRLKHLCSSFSPPAYPNTHGLENKLSINPHTQTEFCPVGGGGVGGQGKEQEEGWGGREKEWGRKLQCGQKSAFSISWGGSGLDRGELQPAPHTKECYQAPFLTLTVRRDWDATQSPNFVRLCAEEIFSTHPINMFSWRSFHLFFRFSASSFLCCVGFSSCSLGRKEGYVQD